LLHQKDTIINYIRDTNKKLIQQITDIELPSLHRYLSVKFTSIKTLDLKCYTCNTFLGKNKKSLAAHRKNCISKYNETLVTDTIKDDLSVKKS
jgi:DNA mismatch repair ATPase MutS